MALSLPRLYKQEPMPQETKQMQMEATQMERGMEIEIQA